MRSSNTEGNLAGAKVTRGSAKEAWWTEELKFEIERLKALLRGSVLTEEERAIAQSRIASYRELAVLASHTPAGWLSQISLLAD